MTNQHFNEYKPKLTFEAILKSALCGIGIGFGVGFLTGLTFWLVGIELVWLLIVASFGIAAVAGVLFYFLRFRPSDMSNARRLDGLGLEERLITMVELEGTDSCIANIQREDAKASLEKLEKSQIKLKIPRKIIVFATTLFVLGAAMTSANIIWPSGGRGFIDDIINDEFTEYVTVVYDVDGGGTIEGDPDQDIEKGTDATLVTAVADEGFMFKEWSDGYTQPTRLDQMVEESVTYTAVFVELEDEEGEEGEGGNGDQDQQGEKGGQSDEEGDENGSSAPDGEFNPNATAGGGQREPSNQVIDGKTFYKEELAAYQELVNGQIEESDELTDEEIDLIKKYLGIV